MVSGRPGWYVWCTCRSPADVVIALPCGSNFINSLRFGSCMFLISG